MLLDFFRRQELLLAAGLELLLDPVVDSKRLILLVAGLALL